MGLGNVMNCPVGQDCARERATFVALTPAAAAKATPDNHSNTWKCHITANDPVRPLPTKTGDFFSHRKDFGEKAFWQPL